VQPTLLELFAQIPDPRRAEGKMYPLPQVMLFCVLGMLSGAISYRKMHSFIKIHFDRLSGLFPSRMKRAPCYAQIRNIMAALDPADVEAAFRAHSGGLVETGQDGMLLLAGDGKVMRGSVDKLIDKKAAQIFSIFAGGSQIILAHVEIDAKTNEIPVAQALIRDLGMANCLFTFDALHCQKKTFEVAEAAGCHVLVQVKENQKALLAALEALPETVEPEETCASFDKGRNREETRRVEKFNCFNILNMPEWDKYAHVAVRVHRRTWMKNTKTGFPELRKEVSWYITDAAGKPAKFYADTIRGHWGIENRDHRVRDGAFAEDASKIRKNPGTFARVVSFGLNILRFNGAKNIQNTLWENVLDIDRVLAYAGW